MYSKLSVIFNFVQVEGAAAADLLAAGKLSRAPLRLGVENRKSAAELGVSGLGKGTSFEGRVKEGATVGQQARERKLRQGSVFVCFLLKIGWQERGKEKRGEKR